MSTAVHSGKAPWLQPTATLRLLSRQTLRPRQPEFPGSSDFSFCGISVPLRLACSQGILWCVTCLWLFPLAITGGRVPHWPGAFSPHPREFSSVQSHSCCTKLSLFKRQKIKNKKKIRKPLHGRALNLSVFSFGREGFVHPVTGREVDKRGSWFSASTV